jgi:hypothetical protein
MGVNFPISKEQRQHQRLRDEIVDRFRRGVLTLPCLVCRELAMVWVPSPEDGRPCSVCSSCHSQVYIRTDGPEDLLMAQAVEVLGEGWTG